MPGGPEGERSTDPKRLSWRQRRVHNKAVRQKGNAPETRVSDPEKAQEMAKAAPMPVQEMAHRTETNGMPEVAEKIMAGFSEQEIEAGEKYESEMEKAEALLPGVLRSIAEKQERANKSGAHQEEFLFNSQEMGSSEESVSIGRRVAEMTYKVIEPNFEASPDGFSLHGDSATVYFSTKMEGVRLMREYQQDQIKLAEGGGKSEFGGAKSGEYPQVESYLIAPVESSE